MTAANISFIRSAHGGPERMNCLSRLPLDAETQWPTLRTILQRPLFARAEVLAGREFLDVPVRWVHVGEIPDIATYLRGQELILSTGVGLRQPRERLLYLERLAQCKVAGICIELGRYLRRVPNDMTQRAGQLGLPLIAFHESVRFVDITQDVHALILQNEQQVLASLRTLGSELQALAAGAEPVAAIVGQVASWLGRPAVFLDDRGDTVCSAQTEQARELVAQAQDLLRTMRPSRTIDPDIPLPDGRSYVLSRRVGGVIPLGLVASASGSDDRVAVGMALDFAAGALGLGLIRQRRLHVGVDHTEAALVRDLLLGTRLPAPALRESLGRAGLGGAMPAQCIVMRARGRGESQDLAAALHTWLALQGLRALAAPWEGEVVAILLDPPPLEAIQGIGHALAQREWSPGAAPLELGFSRRAQLRALPAALREAEQVLSVANLGGYVQSPFYADLGALRLLLGLRDDFDVESFCEDELGALTAYDKVYSEDLVKTLEMLVKAENRTEAAKLLRISRQTLYYRIERLASLLGEDFLSPGRRLALQMALLTSQLLGRTY